MRRGAGLLPFADRGAAGRALADALCARGLPKPVVVLALPRGGVPVALEVARALGAPLDLLIVRKIGAPWQPELAVAALVEGDPPDLVIDEAMVTEVRVSRDWIASQVPEHAREIARRRDLYLAGRARVALQGATVVLVDDGVATGTTVRAALRALQRRGPARVVLAVPVAPADTLERLRPGVDEIVCLEQPEPFEAVGRHYVDFHQVSDASVVAALAQWPGGAPQAPAGEHG